MPKFTIHTTPQYRRNGYRAVPISEVLETAYNACRYAMRGAMYSADDHYEIAAEIVARIVADVVKGQTDRIAADGRPLCSATPKGWLPAHLVTFGKLAGIAANRRREIDTKRDHDRKHAANMARNMETAEGMTEGAPVSPDEARRRTVDILSDLGVARLGKLYTVAYAACRETAGMQPDEIAAELGITRNTLYQHVNRAAKRVPSATATMPDDGDEPRPLYRSDDHAAALGVPTGEGYARKATKSRQETHNIGDRDAGWRDHQNAYGQTAVRVYRDTTAKNDRRRDNRPDWARDLERNRPKHAARLAASAKRARDEERARTADERKVIRLAAGLPARVRAES